MKPVVRVGVLGGTSAGKTYHFGREGILENTLSYCIGPRKGSLGVAGKDNVIALVTNVAVSKEVPTSTLSINYMGFDLMVFGKKTIVRWLEYPGQDNVGLCVFIHNLLRSGDPELLKKVYEIGDRLHRVVLGEEAVNCNELKSVLDKLYNLEEEGGKLLELETIAHSLYPEEIKKLDEKELRDILDKALVTCRASSPKRLRGVSAENVLNGFVYLFVAMLAERILGKTDDKTDKIVKNSLLIESLASYAAAAAYLGDRKLLEDAYVRLLENKSSESPRTPAVINNMCIGPGCDTSSFPHGLITSLLKDRITEWDRSYRQAVWNLLHHRLIVTGPLLTSLLLALVVDSNVLAVMAPFLYDKFIFIYTLKHLATSTNIEVIGGERMREIIRSLYSIIGDNWKDLEDLSSKLENKRKDLEDLARKAEDLRKEIMQYAGYGLSYVVENICSLEAEKRSPTLREKLRILKQFSKARISDNALDKLARLLMEENVPETLQIISSIIDTLNIILVGYWENINKEISIMHSYVIARLLSSAAKLAGLKDIGVSEKSLLIVSTFFDDYMNSLAKLINVKSDKIEDKIIDLTSCILEETKKYLLLETANLREYYQKLEKCENKIRDLADISKLPLPEPVEFLRFHGIELTEVEIDKLFRKNARVLVPGGHIPPSCGATAKCNIPLTAAFLSLIYNEVGRK